MNDDFCINTLKRAGFHECAAYIDGRLRDADAQQDKLKEALNKALSENLQLRTKKTPKLWLEF